MIWSFSYQDSSFICSLLSKEIGTCSVHLKSKIICINGGSSHSEGSANKNVSREAPAPAAVQSVCAPSPDDPLKLIFNDSNEDLTKKTKIYLDVLKTLYDRKVGDHFTLNSHEKLISSFKI